MARSLFRALRQTAADRRELANMLYEGKVAVYTATLEDLATSYGYELTGAGIELSEDVLNALRDEADENAQSIVETFNSELRTFLDDNRELGEPELLTAFETWATDHHEKRAELRAVTEAYVPYADATLAFFAENELEPEFDFGGHGDDDPECVICQALEESNPHPMGRVLEVGMPHIGCRQDWHPIIDANTLPDELKLGGRTGGVLGVEPLRDRFDSPEDAAEFAGAAV